METPIIAYEVTPEANPGLVSDTAVHVAGNSEGMVVIEYLDPNQITGHDYEVNFNFDRSWNLRDLTSGMFCFSFQTHQENDFNFPVSDGMMVRTISPAPGIKDWVWEGGTRWMTGCNFGATLFYGGLFTGPDFFGSNITPDDYVDVEVRFSRTNTQRAYDYLRGGYPNYGYIGYFNCPFTIWDVSANPPRQLNAAFVENNGQLTFDSTWFPGVSGVASREYLFIFNSTYSASPDEFYTSKIPNNDAYDMDILYVVTPELRGGTDPNTDFQEGQKFIIRATKPNTAADIFRFHAGPIIGDMDGSGSIDIADVVFFIVYMFADGPAPTPLSTADTNCDGDINIADAVYMINYIFSDGGAPGADCK